MDPSLGELLFHTELFELHPTLRQVSVYAVETERWVAISGREGRVPEMEAARHFQPHEGDPTGEADTAFWDPGWFDFARHWRIYAPDIAVALIDEDATTAEWMAVGYQDITLYLDPDDPTRLNQDLRQLVCRDFCKASLALKMLQPLDALTVQEVTGGYHITQLMRRRGAQEIRAGLSEARIKMLDLISAIAYSFARCPEEQRAYVKSLFRDEWEQWRLDSAPKIGFLLDLQDTRSLQLPLLDYLEHGVPIYYPFDERYRPKLPLGRRLAGGTPISTSNFVKLVNAVIRRENDALPVEPLPWLEAGAQDLTDDVWMSAAVDGHDTWDSEADLITKGVRALGAAWRFEKAAAYPLLGFGWSEGIIEHGVILLGVLQEVKLRIWARKYRISDPADVLTEALQRGVQFHYAVPYDTIPHFNAVLRMYAPITNAENSGVDASSFVLPHRDNPAEGWSDYLSSVHALLAQPKGTAFLLEGGIAWRLAKEFGPADLFRKVANFPSQALLRNYTGNSTVAGYIGDSVTADELDVLAGRTRNVNGSITRSWWPTNTDFEYNDFSVGEWTTFHESWFQSWLQIYTAGVGGDCGPRNRHAWNRNLQQHGIRMCERDGDYYSTEGVLEVKQLLDEEDGGSWNGVRIIDLLSDD